MTPEKIDRYEIKAEAGRGGMASVYEAFDPRFERTVAVKVLPREFMHDPEFRARFTREAKVIAGLDHPAIVPVYDFGEDNGQPYLVMKLMRGGSLAERLADGPISIEETAVILKRLGSALDRAHDQGIVHRDMKPSNVLFDEYGDAYLADFGIVRVATSGDSALTASGSLIGTPTYMSPEQVYGDKELDGRSDIYALGVILFQMLTGTVPYEADTPARMMMKHVMDPVPQIHQIRPDLPDEFEGIINKAMAKERRERFPNAGELSSALSDVTKRTDKDAVVAELAAIQEEIETELEGEDVPDVDVPTAETASTSTREQAVSSPQPKVDQQPEPVIKRVEPTAQPIQPTYYASESNGKVGIPVWIWGIVGLLLLLCGGSVAGGLYLFQQGELPFLTGDNAPTAIAIDAVATDEPTPESTAIPESTTFIEETTNAPLLSEDNLDAEATRASLSETRAALSGDETPTAAATPVAIATLADQIDAVATRASLEETRAATNADAAPTLAPPNFDPLFGPERGELVHALDNIIKSAYADVDLQDFYVTASINNPFGLDVGAWDFGLTFRQVDLNDELRLVIRSDGSWSLNSRAEEDDAFLDEGDIGDILNTDAGGSNRLELIVLGELGYFFINGRYVDSFTLPDNLNSGDVALGTGFYSSNMQEGSTTSYADYGVWPLDPLFGPSSGELDHIDNDLIKQEYAEGEAADFIMRATFTNPHQADAEIGWDYGFVFRDVGVNEQYWLILTSDEDWTLDYQTEEDDFFLQDEPLDNLNTNANESNELVLIAQNEIGYFFVNGVYIDQLDLSDRTEAGETAVVGAFFLGNERIGTHTEYVDFTIWPLP